MIKERQETVSDCERELHLCIALNDFSQERIFSVYEAYLTKHSFQNLAILNIIKDIILKKKDHVFKEDGSCDSNIIYNRFLPFMQNLSKYLDLNWNKYIISNMTYFILITVLLKQDELWDYFYSEEGYKIAQEIISNMNFIDFYTNKNSSYGISIFTVLNMLYNVYNEYYADDSEKFAKVIFDLNNLINEYLL